MRYLNFFVAPSSHSRGNYFQSAYSLLCGGWTSNWMPRTVETEYICPKGIAFGFSRSMGITDSNRIAIKLKLWCDVSCWPFSLQCSNKRDEITQSAEIFSEANPFFVGRRLSLCHFDNLLGPNLWHLKMEYSLEIAFVGIVIQTWYCVRQWRRLVHRLTNVTVIRCERVSVCAFMWRMSSSGNFICINSKLTKVAEWNENVFIRCALSLSL